jgi:hypothetical protein
MADDPFLEPYEVRQRRIERAGQPVAYKFDPLPDEFLVQVVRILDGAIGEYRTRSTSYVAHSSIYDTSNPSPELIWKGIGEEISYRVGKFDLAPEKKRHRDKFISHLFDPTTTTVRRLSAIEFAFQARSRTDEWFDANDWYRGTFDVRFSASQANDTLNRRFSEHELGYRFANDRIIRVDDEYLYSQVTVPAINALTSHGFDRALQEFMSAHQHYLRGEIGDAITDANNAFESTMKVIAERRNIISPGNANATDLIKLMTRDVLPPTLSSSLTSFRSLLQALPTLRNTTPGAAHGGGSDSGNAPTYLAEYALNLAAANISMLVHAWQVGEERESPKD